MLKIHNDGAGHGVGLHAAVALRSVFLHFAAARLGETGSGQCGVFEGEMDAASRTGETPLTLIAN